MIFRQLFDTETCTFTYLIADEASGAAALIDPVREQVDRDLQLVADLGLRLAWVLETHVHADHVTAAAILRDRTGAKTVMSRRGADCVDLHVGAGDTIRVGAIAVRVLDTPGHTDDSVSYLVGDRVLTGDALTIRGAGRTDFQNGDPRLLYRSIIERLFTLPDDTQVYPGHDYGQTPTSTVAWERDTNPYLRCTTAEEFIALRTGKSPPRPIRGPR